MPIYVEARDRSGDIMRRFPDPAARGIFDAAGDFDRFVNDSYVGYPQGVGLSILQSIDPYVDTEVHSEVMPALLNDIATAPGGR